ncbi:MAG: dihydroxy-acid dehydratase, partial [Rhodosalinus sp.]
TVAGPGLARYTEEPKLFEDALDWVPGPRDSLNDRILRPHAEPFQPTGGLAQLRGNLGEGVIKTSAVKDEHRVIEAPARVFDSPDAVLAAFKAGELTGDCVIVLRFQGPQANGMPELHGLTPALSVLLDRGHRIALVTDGRMSGASGKVPAAIHLSPEAAAGGPLARLRDGDLIRLDAQAGTLDTTADLAARDPAAPDLSANRHGTGRELFQLFRDRVGEARHGAASLV